METKEIKELIELLQTTDYRYIVIKNEGTSIVLSKDKATEPVAGVPNVQGATPVKEAPVPVAAVSAPVVEASPEKAVVVENDANCFIVKSPIVGTYYSAASPEAGPFVKKGDVVKKGDILCIIEAMKLMNEIDCDVDGEIVEICLNNEAVVEYGQPIFNIKVK